MCGRYSAAFSLEELTEIISEIREVSYAKRYNIAPTQEGLIVRNTCGQRSAELKRFGINLNTELVINARSETVLTKAVFNPLTENGRCLVLADGFYEWRKQGSRKIPYRFALPTNKPFAFAGLSNPQGFVIVTTEPNKTVEPIHNRMPAILAEPQDYEVWLSGSLSDALDLLRPYPGELNCYEVSQYVNSVHHDDEKCIMPVNKLW